MWLQSNLFGGPWQSWSVSNLCFRQKFLRQVLQVTGTSWKEKTTQLILTIASTMKVKYCHSASFPGYQHESLGTRLLLQKLLALHWHCSFVARLSMLQILSLASYEAMKAGGIESLGTRLLHWQTNLPLLAARIGTAVSNGLQEDRLIDRWEMNRNCAGRNSNLNMWDLRTFFALSLWQSFWMCSSTCTDTRETSDQVYTNDETIYAAYK